MNMDILTIGAIFEIVGGILLVSAGKSRKSNEQDQQAPVAEGAPGEHQRSPGAAGDSPAPDGIRPQGGFNLEKIGEATEPQPGPRPSSDDIHYTRRWTRVSMVMCAALWACGVAYGSDGITLILTSLCMAFFLVMLSTHEANE